MDLKSNELIKRLLVKLEKLYPEKKIFALSSLDDDLRESLNTTYRQLCYPNMDGLLHDLGYELISASAARDLRSFVLYLPGQEPEPIRSKIFSIPFMTVRYLMFSISSSEASRERMA